MRIGVIGLGDIAKKAYLPVLMAQPGLEPHLVTRTPDPARRRFLDAVREGRTLSAQDALRTHELCERVLDDLLERSH